MIERTVHSTWHGKEGAHIRDALHGTTLVVGLGVSGAATLRWLHDQGVDVQAVDSRPQPPGLAAIADLLPHVPHHCGTLQPAWFETATRIVLSPGLDPRTLPWTQASMGRTEILGELELFAHAVAPQARIVTITGTNGKSTVTEWVGEMGRQAGLRTAVGGNLGTPALALLDDDIELYVLELSSFQLELCRSLRADAATILNLSPDHLDRHGSMAAYAAAKQRILKHAACQVMNDDDPASLGLAHKNAPLRTFGHHQGDCRLVQRDGQQWLQLHDKALLPCCELQLTGAHNYANAMAAALLADAVSLPRSAICAALRTFKGLEHRCCVVASTSTLRWIDDSKATNVGAAVAALRGLSAPLVLIAGGAGKGQDFSPLGAELERSMVRGVVLLGRDATDIEAVLPVALPRCWASNMDDAVRQATTMAQPGDSIVLAPACASQDMFRDYRDRGQCFAAAARRQALELSA